MASARNYIKNIIEDQKNIVNRLNTMEEEISSIRDDSEANAQAIVELAEIIGGDENG